MILSWEERHIMLRAFVDKPGNLAAKARICVDVFGEKSRGIDTVVAGTGSSVSCALLISLGLLFSEIGFFNLISLTPFAL